MSVCDPACNRKALHKANVGGPALLAPVVQAARDLVEQLSLVRARSAHGPNIPPNEELFPPDAALPHAGHAVLSSTGVWLACGPIHPQDCASRHADRHRTGGGISPFCMLRLAAVLAGGCQNSNFLQGF